MSGGNFGTLTLGGGLDHFGQHHLSFNLGTGTTQVVPATPSISATLLNVGNTLSVGAQHEPQLLSRAWLGQITASLA